MMRRLWMGVVTACLLFCLCACSAPKEIDLYIVPRDTITAQMSGGDIAALAKKSGRLALSEQSIEGVDWEKQKFRLTRAAVPSVGSVSHADGGSALLKTKDTDAFVLLVGGKYVYHGGFAMGVSNPNAPCDILIEDSGRYAIRVTLSAKAPTDQRYSDTLYKALSANGLLRSEVAEN